MTTYSGVTAYIKQGPGNDARLRFLAELIPALSPFAAMDTAIHSYFERFIHMTQFAELQDNADVFETTHHLPYGTPKAYQQASVTHGVYAEKAELTRIYLPVVSGSKGKNDYIIQYALTPVLDRLFGSDLVSVKVKSIDESGYFDDAPVCIHVAVGDNEPHVTTK